MKCTKGNSKSHGSTDPRALLAEAIALNLIPARAYTEDVDRAVSLLADAGFILPRPGPEIRAEPPRS